MLRDTDLKPRTSWMQEKGEGGGAAAARINCRREVKGEGISNMLGQMQSPTVVCHSCRFHSFQYLCPSKRFLLSPFSFSSSRSCTTATLFIQTPLSPSCVASLSYCAFLASLLPPSRSSLDRPLFFFPSLSHVITVSTVACTRIYTRV